MPAGRDHVELDNGVLAGVTDRGLRRHRNEDAMAIAAPMTSAGPFAVAVVCDGVSTSDRADEAALAAAEAAALALSAAVRAPAPGTGASATDAPADLRAASAAAISAAGDAVATLAESAGDPPSCTYVSAVTTATSVAVCWAGDSRAYWLPDGAATEARQLTTDDSLAEDGTAGRSGSGGTPSHVITRWLGADASESDPHIAIIEPPGPGAVLLCSDGMWHHLPAAAELAQLALPAALTDPLAAACALVACALDAGGHDNVTVVLIPFPPRRRESLPFRPASERGAAGEDPPPGGPVRHIEPRSAAP